MDNTVLITGASRGIGSACAQMFVGAGWNAVLVAGSQQLVEFAAGLGRAVAVVGDVADPAVNEKAAQAAISTFGRLDHVIGNAGVTLSKTVDETTEADMERLFSINVKALIYLAQAVHGPLAKTRGSYTIMASNKGLVGQRHSPIYCATKGAAVQIARALALDWAPEGIRVNAICPGVIRTPMVDEFVSALPDPEAVMEDYARTQPLGRLGTAEEVASVALFLASAGAGFVNGVALPVDAGFTAQ